MTPTPWSQGRRGPGGARAGRGRAKGPRQNEARAPRTRRGADAWPLDQRGGRECRQAERAATAAAGSRPFGPRRSPRRSFTGGPRVGRRRRSVAVAGPDGSAMSAGDGPRPGREAARVSRAERLGLGLGLRMRELQGPGRRRRGRRGPHPRGGGGLGPAREGPNHCHDTQTTGAQVGGLTDARIHAQTRSNEINLFSFLTPCSLWPWPPAQKVLVQSRKKRAGLAGLGTASRGGRRGFGEHRAQPLCPARPRRTPEATRLVDRRENWWCRWGAYLQTLHGPNGNSSCGGGGGGNTYSTLSAHVPTL